jgi:O-antigen ligase
MSFIMQDFISNKKKLGILITTIALTVGIASLSVPIQYNISITNTINNPELLNNYDQSEGTKRFGGFYSNSNALGKIVMSGVPFLLFLSLNARSFILKALYSLLFISSFFSLGMAVSRTHLLAFVVFIISYIALALKHKIISGKKIILISIISAVSLLILSNFFIDQIEARSQEDISESLRYDILLKGIDVLKENPLFGIGFDNFQKYKTSDDKYIWMYSVGHDIVSAVFASIGLSGSIFLILIFFKPIRYLHNAANNMILQSDSYLFHLIIVLQAGCLAQMFSLIGSTVITEKEYWVVYFGLSVLINRWGRESIMENAAKPYRIMQC